MDTASPVSRPDHVVRLAALLLAVALAALSLLVALGPSLADLLQPAADDTLLGPFRWVTTRGLA
ncbi:MAG: hypothetical protein U0667_01625 [Chloroflexota bacterium]